YMTPPLTTIRQPIYGIGEIAAELLLKNIQNPTEKLENRLLDISLINRSSTKSIDNK
ncbi:substrate-binding domain-containing protein, partial [Escherichia coli]|nr:substrate-binding domain-containing protein [Escherichia coli]